ncbi:MAG: hypothetical protein Q7S86_04410 [bacterium]|nr:hypothetical protein [bacterium]
MDSSEENKSSPQESGLPQEDTEILLSVFREEIRALQAVERENKKQEKGGTVNLLKVDVDELTVEDMEMWEAVKNYSVVKVSTEVFEQYRVAARESGNQSRTDFAGFVANKFTAAMAWGNIHGLYE